MFIWILHRLCLQYIVKKDTCDDTSTYIARLDFTPFRIENAQWQRYLSLIYADKVGVLNEKRCNRHINRDPH